jgi:hypothetical protein
MFATSMRAPTWPAHLSFLAAGLFTLASGGTNLFYGIAKGTDAASSLVWATVSIGVSIIFALSWPAFIVSLDRRQWARAALVLIALFLTGTYSVTAALGSAMGGRANAAIEEKDTTDKRTKAEAAYDVAKAELATLKPSRPVAELEAMRKSWHERMGKKEAWFYEPELARAKRRAELEAKVERAAGELAHTGSAKIANFRCCSACSLPFRTWDPDQRRSRQQAAGPTRRAGDRVRRRIGVGGRIGIRGREPASTGNPETQRPANRNTRCPRKCATRVSKCVTGVPSAFHAATTRSGRDIGTASIGARHGTRWHPGRGTAGNRPPDRCLLISRSSSASRFV